jgi:hypothetical protein
MRSCLLVLLAPLAGCSALFGEGTKTGFDAALGVGSMQHRTKGSPLDDRTDAAYLLLGVEAIGPAGLGGGLRIESSGSDDDLFTGAPVGENSSAGDGELYLHGTYDLGGERPMPLRFGFFTRDYMLEGAISGSETEWLSSGLRFEFAPQLPLHRGDAVQLDLASRLGLGLGQTWIETSGSSETWDSTMTAMDLGAALRADVGHAEFELGYLWRTAHYDRSDEAAGETVPAVSTEFSGLVFSARIRF